MIEPARGEPERCLQIFGFEVGHFFENLLRRQPGGKQIEYVADANAHAPNARTATALFRINGDSVCERVHD